MPDSTPDPDDAAFRLKLEKLKYYRSETRHEYSLMLTRLGAYMTSQSFLFIAYPSAMGTTVGGDARFSLPVSLLLCILGLALSVHVYPSLKGAVDRVDAWHEMERRLFEVQRTREGFEIEGVDPDLVGPSADSGLGWLRKAPPGGQPTGRTSAGSRLHG